MLLQYQLHPYLLFSWIQLECVMYSTVACAFYSSTFQGRWARTVASSRRDGPSLQQRSSVDKGGKQKASINTRTVPKSCQNSLTGSSQTKGGTALHSHNHQAHYLFKGHHAAVASKIPGFPRVKDRADDETRLAQRQHKAGSRRPTRRDASDPGRNSCAVLCSSAIVRWRG